MYAQPPKNPALAAILSFLIPGLGQIYNGEIGKGLIIIVVQVINFLLATIIIGIFTGLAVFIWAIYDAYVVAQRLNAEMTQQMVEQQKRCPRCAEVVNAGARLCRFCGYEFMPNVTPQLTALPTPPAQTLPVAQPGPRSAGSVLPPAKPCPHCGQQVKAEANFCQHCGHKFEAEVV